MKIAVTGSSGQLALSIRERAAENGVEIVFVGRPSVDFLKVETIGPALEQVRPDLFVNAAAYTAVDQAERDEAAATMINADAAGEVAKSAERIGAPIIHISTDYVFDGKGKRPYRESDPVAPLGAYGRSKLAGEAAVAAGTRRHVVLRTAWVHSPFGKNFVRTMLALGLKRDAVGVVADQIGNPSYAPDIAEGILSIARQLIKTPDEERLRGVFHMAGTGAAAWADLAEETFRIAEVLGRPPVRVERIASPDYPTLVPRPANSQLDCRKVRGIYGVALPKWRNSVAPWVKRLLDKVEMQRGGND